MTPDSSIFLSPPDIYVRSSRQNVHSSCGVSRETTWSSRRDNRPSRCSHTTKSRALGLAPVMVLFKSHAIPAVWLVDDRFPEGIVSDAARLRTAIALRYLVAFDSSTIVDVTKPPIERAFEAADRLLTKDADFEHALDV